jgi:hypothetical protein
MQANFIQCIIRHMYEKRMEALSYRYESVHVLSYTKILHLFSGINFRYFRSSSITLLIDLSLLEFLRSTWNVIAITSAS